MRYSSYHGYDKGSRNVERNGMGKKITAILLILTTGGVWIYLDYLNKQELALVEQTRQEFLVFHAQAKERFNSCQFRSDGLPGSCKKEQE